MSMIVIMPGGFHPFHAGHFALYQSAKKAFPNADIYVAATNDQSTRPFPFATKEKLAKLAGVDKGHFVQVKSPFQAKEITSHYNPEQDVLVFVRSEKDRTEQPKPGGTKKDGSPAYFQPWTGKNLQPFAKHAYIAYLPTVEFGPGITSASEIRSLWPTMNDQRKLALVQSLYPATQKNPKLAQNVAGIFDQVMGGQVSEASVIDVPEKTTVYYKPRNQDKIYILGKDIPGKHIDQYIKFVKNKYQDLQNARPEEIYWEADRPQKFMDESYSDINPNGPGLYAAEKTPPVTPYGNKEREFRGAMAEGSTGVSVRKWANQVRKDHGSDVKFWNRKEGSGAVDSVIAKNSQGEIVGVYNRKTGYPTVFEPKQEVAESFGNNYPGTYEEEYGNIPMKPGGHRNHALTTEEKDKEKDDLFIQADPESDQLLRFAQQHYPEAGSKQKAFIKFVQRSLKHSKESDQNQDQEIVQLQQQINDIKNAINKGNVSESLDYVEEK